MTSVHKRFDNHTSLEAIIRIFAGRQRGSHNRKVMHVKKDVRVNLARCISGDEFILPISLRLFLPRPSSSFPPPTERRYRQVTNLSTLSDRWYRVDKIVHIVGLFLFPIQVSRYSVSFYCQRLTEVVNLWHIITVNSKMSTVRSERIEMRLSFF